MCVCVRSPSPSMNARAACVMYTAYSSNTQHVLARGHVQIYVRIGTAEKGIAALSRRAFRMRVCNVACGCM
jgi:hypothetical protein